MEIFMNRHVSEIYLPIFACLMSTKLMQGLLYYMGPPLWVGLRIHLAGGVKL